MATLEAEVREATTGWGAMSAAEKAASVADMPDVNLSVDGAGTPGVVKGAGAKPVQDPPEPTKQDETPTGDADDDSGAADADDQDEVVEGEEVVDGKPKPAETDWHDDADTYDFAKRMGISDEDYDEISTREELDRTLRMIDRKAYDAEKARQAGGQQQPSAPPPASEEGQPPVDLLAEVQKLHLPDDFDESARVPVNNALDFMAKTVMGQQQELQAMKALLQKQQTDQLAQKIEGSIDGLNNPERYGKPGEKLSRTQAANRAKFRQELLMRGSVHEKAGRHLEPSDLAKYADAAAFVDENRLTIQREYDERLRKESRRISPNAGGNRQGQRRGKEKTPSPEAIREEILADPEINQAFAKLHGR